MIRSELNGNNDIGSIQVKTSLKPVQTRKPVTPSEIPLSPLRLVFGVLCDAETHTAFAWDRETDIPRTFTY
jgi:hypothetical protein